MADRNDDNATAATARADVQCHPVRQWGVWLNLKRQRPDALLVFEFDGHFFAFCEDAVAVSRELQIPLAVMQDDKDSLPMAEIPSDHLVASIAVLQDCGYEVAMLNGDQPGAPRPAHGFGVIEGGRKPEGGSPA